MKRFLRFITFVLITSSACNQSYIQLATETSVPATPTSILEPATQRAAPQPASPTDWLSQLEVITAGNWSRLQLLKTFPAEMPLNRSAAAISPDGKTLAVGSGSGVTIFFIDLLSGQLSQTVSFNGAFNREAVFNTLQYLPDGTLLANSDGPYVIYHMDTTGNILSTWDGSSFAISVDKKIMAYGTNEGTTLVDIASNTSLGSFEGGYALDYSFSPDGSKLAVNLAGVDYVTTVIWDVPGNVRLAELDETGMGRYSPDGKFLAITSYAENSGALKIFTPDGATELTTFNVSGQPPLFSQDGSIMAVQSGDPLAWDTTNWQPLDSSVLQGALYSFSPDGRILLTRTSDGGILFWGVFFMQSK